jgi:hypothetical protein
MKIVGKYGEQTLKIRKRVGFDAQARLRCIATDLRGTGWRWSNWGTPEG